MMIWYIIPARAGSKGLPYKNRRLFDCTADLISTAIKSNTLVSTDDAEIMQAAHEKGFTVHERSAENSNDTATMKDTLLEVITDKHIENDDIIFLLYLTYPERTQDDIVRAFDFFLSTHATSLLCRKEVKSHPYLCLYDNGIYGKQIVEHDLFRRQDYPKCFEISHFIGIFRAGEIKNLNSNLYNDDTVFYSIGDVIDVDTDSDIKRFLNG